MAAASSTERACWPFLATSPPNCSFESTATKDSLHRTTASNFIAPVYAGDYIEAQGRIVRVGKTSRRMEFEARKVIAARPEIGESAADALDPPIVVCRATGTCVTPKAKQRK